MFALWYSILSWKEYRHTVLEKFKSNLPLPNQNASTNKNDQELSANTASQSIPTQKMSPLPPKLPTQNAPQPSKQSEPPKISPQPQPPQRLQPVKAPRSPSPHPILSEASDDIDFSEEESEEEDDSIVNGNDWPEDARVVVQVNPSQDMINIERIQQNKDTIIKIPLFQSYSRKLFNNFSGHT